jgi:predicted permease
MRLPKWFRWRSDEELDEELQAHLEDAVQLNLDRGMAPEEARFAARRVVGNPTRIKERAREADPFFKLDLIAKDLHYAWRGLRRNPGFTFAAVLSLALGIGANTAIFSFVDGLMLRPIPAPRAQELVRVFGTTQQERFDKHSYREFTAYREQNRSLAGLAAETLSPFSIRVGKQSVASYGHFVSGNFFSTLEVEPFLGRTFVAEDDSPAAKTIAVVLSHRIWSASFAADPSVVGSAVRLNGQPAVVVGVLPDSYTGTDTMVRPQIYAPLAMIGKMFPEGADALTNPQRRSFNIWGRLKPGIAAESAQADLLTISRSLESFYPESNRARGVSLMPEIDSRFEQSQGNDVFLVLMLGMAGLVLLVACTNVVNLLLGRAQMRTREFAIRISVGASRARLVGQLLTESFLLALLGTAAGLLMASWVSSVLAAIQLPTEIPLEFALRIDSRVLLYTCGAAVVSVFAFGLWPALAATRSGLSARARSQSQRANWGRNGLVVSQTALVTMLLIAAGLVAQSFVRVSTASPGFRVDNVLLASFDPALSGYEEARTRGFYDSLLQNARSLPGVRSAVLASHVQLGPLSTSDNVVRDGLDTADSRNRREIMVNVVTPGFFGTMDTPVLRGRVLDSRDSATAPVAAVVNETMAAQLWPGADAIGKRIHLLKENKVAEVVGIAKDGDYDDLGEIHLPYFYLAMAQYKLTRMTLMLHTAGDPASVAPAMRAAVQSIAPDLPIHDVHSMRSVFNGFGLFIPRVTAQLVGVMAGIGLVIGLTGLYAVIAFVVNRRTREFGIRMALGATPRSILQGVLLSGFRVTAVGLVVGLAGALAITGYLEPLLAKVDPHDPVTFTGVSILLLAVALAACWVPARQASLVDPAVTLRQE